MVIVADVKTRKFGLDRFLRFIKKLNRYNYKKSNFDLFKQYNQKNRVKTKKLFSLLFLFNI